MKELSIEEKAKAYDEALHKAKRIINVCVDDNTECRSMIACIQEIFPELKESEDEKIRKELLAVINDLVLPDEQQSRFIAWLEKQGEHKKFRDSIQVGDKVTRNQDGMLVNLSQLKRIAKPNETKPCEQNTWSEEDEKMLKYAINMIEWYSVVDKSKSRHVSDWLKSLRLHSQWKPSDAQMASITCAVRKMKESACYDSELVSLLNDLKKLKE